MSATLYLVAGSPATGKTTLAGWLSQALSLPMMSKDRIRERLFDQLGFRSRMEKVRLGQAAQDLLLAFAQSHVQVGASCILESNFSAMDKAGLQALFCPMVTVLLTCDSAVLYRRFLARDQAPGRHRGHVVNDCFPEPPGSRPYVPPMTEEAFTHRMATAGIADFHLGQTFQVDTTDFQAVDLDALAACILKRSQPEG